MEKILDDEIRQILYEKINNSNINMLNIIDSKQFGFELNKKEKKASDILKSLNKNDQKQIYLLKKLNNPFIITHIDYVRYKLFTNIENLTTLADLIHNCQSMNKKFINSELKLNSWCLQILKGLDYIHSKSPTIIHGNLNPKNIFLNKECIKIGGISLKYDNNVKQNEDLSYLSPELIKKSLFYNEKVDIWSFGCLLYELLTLNKLFNEKINDDIKTFYLDIKKYEIILNKCLNKNINERNNAKELIKLIKNICLTNTSNLKNQRIKNNQENLESFEIVSDLISCSVDKTIKIWYTVNGKCTKTLVGHACYIKSIIQISKRELISCSSDKTIKIWDMTRETCIKTLRGHDSEVSCMKLLPNGDLASGSLDKNIKIWNLNSGKCILTLEQHCDSILCLELLPNSQLVSGSMDHTIRIWDISDYENTICIRILEDHSGPVSCFKLLNTGELASASMDCTIKVWNTQSWVCLKTLVGHSYSVRCLKQLKSGRLVSGSGDKTIKVWDLDKEECLLTLEGHASFITCLETLKTGELISGSGDKTIKIWDLNQSKCVKTLEGHKDWVSELKLLKSSK